MTGDATILTAGLIVSRFLHFLSLSILFGGALFPFYGVAGPMADRCAGLRWLRPLLLVSAALGLASGLSWFAFAALAASGNAADAFWPDFGRLWLTRLVVAAGLVIVLLARRATMARCRIVVFGALLLLASLAFVGHADGDQRRAAALPLLADMVHLLASGIWIGALVVFARLMIMGPAPRADDLRSLHHALARFSGIGPAVVAALVLTGMINPGFAASLKTPYGRVLIVKLALFAAMLALAAANRFWFSPRLSGRLDVASAATPAMRGLKASILVETALGVLVLVLVGWLGTLASP